MNSFNLARMVRRPSKRPITFAPIQSTKAQANSLALIYLRVVKGWAAETDRIVGIYERTLGELQTDTAEELGGEINSIADAIERLMLILTPDLRDWAFSVERVQRGKWIRNILSATAVDLSTILSVGDVIETVESVIEWNVGLIRDVSNEARRRISNAVFAGLQQRKPAREVAKEIREATGMARARSVRIAGHQAVNLGERLNDARRVQAGLTHWKWRHSGKRNPREEHVARDGKIYTEATAPKDRPGQLPACGCTSQGVVVFEDE